MAVWVFFCNIAIKMAKLLRLKGNHSISIKQIYSYIFLPSLLSVSAITAASFVAPARKVRIRLRPSTDFYADYSYVSIYFTTFAHIIYNR